jgi:hypothetical protein
VVAVSGPAPAEFADSNTSFLALIEYVYLIPERRPVKTNGAKFATVKVTTAPVSGVATIV